MSQKPMKSCDLFCEDTLHLPEGKVVVRTPLFLSPESRRDLGDFLELILRCVDRSAPPVAQVIEAGGNGAGKPAEAWHGE